MTRRNEVTLEGHCYHVENIDLGLGKIAQVCDFLYEDGRHKIVLWAKPDKDDALNERERVVVSARLCGRHLELVSVIERFKGAI